MGGSYGIGPGRVMAAAIEQGALEAGADAFLTKPCLPEDLELKIRALLDHRLRALAPALLARARGQASPDDAAQFNALVSDIRRWLDRAPERLELRDEGLLKLFFAGAKPDAARKALEARRAHSR